MQNNIDRSVQVEILLNLMCSSSEYAPIIASIHKMLEVYAT